MSQGCVEKVLVVGGGIGGLSAAIALAKNKVHVMLVERNTAWGALGAGLTFNGATARAFRQLGVLEQILAAGSGHSGPRICDPKGNILVEGHSDPRLGSDLPTSGGILRPILHEILKSEALKSGVSARTGVTVQSAREVSDRVDVVLSDGDHDEFDLVIGADGLGSNTRTMLFPAAVNPQFTGQVCWRAVAPRPSEVTCGEIYMGGPHKVGINPISKSQMYMFVLVHSPDNPWIEPTAWPSRLREVLAGYGGHVGAIRDRLNGESQINYRPLEGLMLALPWHKGRVVLIGDAVHATTPHVGHGAGLAVEDGLVLAEEILATSKPENALIAFENRRYSRCEAVVNGSLEIGKLEMSGASPEKQRQLYGSILEEIAAPI